MTTITGYHAHIYFNQETLHQAEQLIMEADRQFDLKVGRIHKKLVGPHPEWSCQLAFQPELFGAFIPWLALHRNGLTIFTHPDTGDFLKDHIDHAIWMGSLKKLNLT